MANNIKAVRAGRWTAVLVAGALVMGAGMAKAADLVVAEAKGVAGLAEGQTIDGTKVLKLDAGARVTLIGSDGRTIKLRGPYEQAPAPTQTADAGGVVDSLKNLVSQRGAGTATLGVVRAATTEKDLPEPWLIDVSRPGNRCIIEKSQAVFWRPEALPQKITMKVSPADQSWAANGAWPEQTDRLKMPPNLPLRDGQSYVIDLAGTTNQITMHVLPATIQKDAVRAAWMVEKGCEQQAAALVKTIQ